MVDSLLHRLLHAGVIVICRKIYGQPLLQLANALYRGGIRQMEITFDQSDPEHLSRTTEAIKTLCTAFPDMDIGAGTVLNREQAKEIKDRAEFGGLGLPYLMNRALVEGGETRV